MLPGVHDSQGKAKINKQTVFDYYLKPKKAKMGRYREMLSNDSIKMDRYTELLSILSACMKSSG